MDDAGYDDDVGRAARARPHRDLRSLAPGQAADGAPTCAIDGDLDGTHQQAPPGHASSGGPGRGDGA